jgi:signal transduction histidine kinase/ligand-binding sensor domain-containing protein
MYKTQKLFLYLVLLFFFEFDCFIVYSQEYKYNGSYLIDHYTSKEYNASSQVWSASSDSRNLMFFGSNRALLVFDGVRWKQYQASNKSIIRSISVDDNNIVYVGSYNEFGRFLPDSLGDYTYESLSKLLPDSIPVIRNVWQTHATSHGVYFIGESGVYHFYNGNINYIQLKVNALFGFKIQDDLWIVDAEKGLAKVRNGEITYYKSTQIFGRKSFGLVNVIESENGYPLIITQSGQIFIFNENQDFIEEIVIPKDLQNYLKTKGLYNSVKLGQERYAIGTLRGGVVILNNNFEIIRIIKKSNGLKTGMVYGIYSDNNNDLWIMGENGIAHVNTNYNVHRYAEDHGLDGFVTDVVQYKGRTYVSTLKGVFYLENFELDNIEQKLQPVSRIDMSTWGFWRINNRLLAYTSKGLFQIIGSNAKIVIPDLFIFSLSQSELFPGKLFIGLLKGMAVGQMEFSGENDIRILNVKTIEGVEDRVLGITVDADKNLWLSTHTEGLKLLIPGNDDFDNNKVISFSSSNGLPADNNNVSAQMIGNDLIIATKKGLYKVDSTQMQRDSLIHFVYDKKWNSYFEGDSVSITGIISVTDSSFIIDGGGTGFLQILKDSVSFNTAFFSRIKNELSYIRYEKDLNLVNVATSGSFLISEFNNCKVRYSIGKPQIRMVSFGSDSVVFNGNYFNDSSNEKIETIQTGNCVPVINYKDNNLFIEFAAVYYVEPERTQYQYKLDGFDDGYTNWSSKPEANYTNIPEGEYIFNVRSRNIYGEISDLASYRFLILSPWYRTSLAYFLYFIGIVLSVVIIIRLYAKSLQNKNRRLDEIVKERTAELQAKNEEVIAQRNEIEQQNEEIQVQKDELVVHKNHLEQLVEQRTAALKRAKERAEESDKLKSAFLSNLSHEIRTPMNAIVGYSDLITEEDDEAVRKKYSELVSTNVNSLLNLIDNIIDLSHLEAQQVTLNSNKTDPDAVLVEVYHKFLSKAKKQSLELIISKDSSSKVSIQTDENRLKQILEHLIDNALKYTSEGSVVISLEKESGSYSSDILFFIKDTGVGMSEQEISKVFQYFTKVEKDIRKVYRGAGIGLALCQKIISLMGGRIWIESEENKGTTVYFTIPKKEG